MRRREPLDIYADLLAREIELTGARTSARQVTHLHWGGGTPSILGEGRMARLIETIGRIFNLGAVG
jgi:oxygen-independent coproporphyrinogen-3 oxidase